MNRFITIGVTAICGMTFGLGTLVSGMANPAKVISFFNLAGKWDPSLGLVMAAALSVTFIGYRILIGKHVPLFAEKQMLPTATQIDSRLIMGAASFGAGWGLGGLCPGPALSVFTIGGESVTTFVFAMLCGIGSAKFIARSRSAA